MIPSATGSKLQEHCLLGATEPKQARPLQEGPGSEGDGVGGSGGRQVPASSLVPRLREQRRLPGDAEDGDVAGGESQGNSPAILVSTGRRPTPHHFTSHGVSSLQVRQSHHLSQQRAQLATEQPGPILSGFQLLVGGHYAHHPVRAQNLAGAEGVGRRLRPEHG